MNLNKSPLVSVIIPVFNGAKFITEALNSVFSQSYSNLEVIVIDDGSTDSSNELVSKFKNVQHIRQKNAGPAASRNLGCKLARGDFIAFLDQDDVWLPHKLEMQIKHFLKFPGLGLVLCHQQFIFDKDLSQLPYSAIKPSYSPSAVVIKPDLLKTLGGLSEDYPFYSEADLFIRIKEQGIEFDVLPDTLLMKRIHQTNLSNRTDLTSKELMRIIRASFERKKMEGPKDFDSRT